MKNKIYNPDLLEERAKCNFNKDELTRCIFPMSVLDDYNAMADEIVKHP